jgi:hypothetical protein
MFKEITIVEYRLKPYYLSIQIQEYYFFYSINISGCFPTSAWYHIYSMIEFLIIVFERYFFLSISAYT